MKKGIMFRSMEHIDSDLIDEAEIFKSAKKKNTRVKWGTIAACLCIVLVGAVIVIPKFILKTGTGKDADIGQPQLGGVEGSVGVNEGIMYSVAIFPAERKAEEVKDAYAEKIYEVEAQNEKGLGEYLPTDLPNGYHFGNASIYVTTMNDGTVYKMLRVTYRTGEESEPLTDAAGAQLVPGLNELGDEFTFSIWGFRPDTSINIYHPDEINEGVLSKNWNGSLFYVQIEDVYIGIEPLSLSIDETIGLVNNIMK